MQLKVVEKTELKYSLLVGGHFAVMAVMSFTVTLLRSHGVTDGTIGIVLALPPLVSVFIQEIFGTVTDRYPEKCSVHKIIICLLLATLSGFLLLYAGAYRFEILVVVFALFGAGVYSASPFYSSLAIQYEESGIKVRYSMARGLGSFTYGIACCLLGIMIQKYHVDLIVPIGIVLVAGMLYMTYHIPDGRRKGKRKAVKSSSMIYSSAYVSFLGASFFLFFGHFILNTYMIDVVTNLGGNNRHVGYTQLLLSLSEIPAAFLFPYLKKRFGIRQLILFCGVFMFLKIFGNAMAPSLPALMAIQLLQGLGNGLYWSASVYYVNELVTRESQVRGQSLLFIFCSGISGFVANLAGGRILDDMSLSVLKEAAVMSGVIGILLTVFSAGKKRKV